MEPMKDFMAKLNAVNWRTKNEITAEAVAAIEESVSQLKSAVLTVSSARGIDPTEAHMLLETAGCDSEEYKESFDWIAEHLDTTNAGMREPLILNIAAAYSWHLEPGLADIPNPWEPLLNLYLLGFPARIDCDEETDSIAVVVSLGAVDERSYSIV